jgi:hypothetical protein
MYPNQALEVLSVIFAVNGNQFVRPRRPRYTGLCPNQNP